MDRPIIPIKTPAGQAEMSSRQRRISQRHRTMLLLVDGKRTEAQVRALSAQAGVPGICFDELMGLGLIVAPQPEPPSTARNGAASAAASAASAASSAPPIDGNSGFGDDSELPPSRTLPPESIFSDTAVGNAAPSSWASWATAAGEKSKVRGIMIKGYGRYAIVLQPAWHGVLGGAYLNFSVRVDRECWCPRQIFCV